MAGRTEKASQRLFLDRCTAMTERIHPQATRLRPARKTAPSGHTGNGCSLRMWPLKAGKFLASTWPMLSEFGAAMEMRTRRILRQLS
jgi:hypothetical protein